MDSVTKLLKKIPKLLASLTTIEVSNCSFGKSASERFSKIINSSVRTLIFNHTRFIDNGAVICSKLQKLSKLKEISFVGVDLRNAHKELCKLISKGKPMISLQLLQAYTSEDYCRELFDTMKYCSTLKSLELHNIQFDVENMIPAIASNSSLTRLLIRGDGNNASYALADLENAKKNLLELDLQQFTWKDEESSRFMEKLGEYRNLTKLVVGKIYYHPDRSTDLTGSIQQLTSLKSLDISSTLFFNQHMRDALLSNTSITDLGCTRGQLYSVMAKCQRVNKSVNFQSLSFASPPSGYNVADPDDFKSILQLSGLTKVQLNALYFDIGDFIAGLNSVNCSVTNLEIINSLNDTEAFELSTALEKNSTLQRLSMKNNSLNVALHSLCRLIRANRSIQYLSATEEATYYNTPPYKEIITALKVNKTLLYLEMPSPYLDLADQVAAELPDSNLTLLHFSPVSADYRVDMWLQRNKQLRGVIAIVLQNIIRTNSVLPLEIWVKIFSHLNAI
jgi:hypothetical protein